VQGIRMKTLSLNSLASSSVSNSSSVRKNNQKIRTDFKDLAYYKAKVNIVN